MMYRVNSEYDVKTILFLNREDNAGILCEDRNDGFYSEDPSPLKEFLDGYQRARKDGHPYEDIDDPQQVDLMNQFISTVDKIYTCGLEYSVSNMQIIKNALNTFGL